MRLLLVVAIMLGMAAPAVSQTANPMPTPAPRLSPTAIPSPIAHDWHAAAIQLQNDYNLFVMNYQKFGVSVYAPWCGKRGVDTVKLLTPWHAWPAHVWCKGMPLKGPSITVNVKP